MEAFRGRVRFKTELGAHACYRALRKEKAVHTFYESDDLAHLGSIEKTKTRKDIDWSDNRWGDKIIGHATDNEFRWTKLQSVREAI